MTYLLSLSVPTLIFSVILFGIVSLILVYLFNKFIILPIHLKEMNDASPLDKEDLMTLMRKRK